MNIAFSKEISIGVDNIRDLGFLQRLRNSIAHEFAYLDSNKEDLWYTRCNFLQQITVARLSKDRFVKLIRIIARMAVEIDSSLGPHIGLFELFQFWHNLRENIASRSTPERYKELYKEGARAKIMSLYYYNLTGTTIGRNNGREIFHLYDAV